MKLIKQNYPIKSGINELIFLLWIWMIPILKTIFGNLTLQNRKYYLIYGIILILFSLRKKIINLRIMIFVLIMYIVYIFDLFFRTNSMSLFKVYEFTSFGGITLYFFSKVRSFKKILYYNVWISIIIFILNLTEGINNYPIYKNYMVYGFNILLPTCMGIHIGRKYFRKRYLLGIEIINFIFLILYANRSSVASYILFLIISKIFIDKIPFKKIIFLGSIIVFFVIFLPSLIEVSYEILSQFNLKSRIITKFYIFFQKGIEKGNLNELMAGRLELYSLALNKIKENILLGNGVGIYESIYGIYSHNIILDLFLEFGIVGFFVVMMLIIYSLFKIRKFQYYDKIYGITLFFLGIPKLFFSSTYHEEKFFWLYIVYGLFNKGKNK